MVQQEVFALRAQSARVQIATPGFFQKKSCLFVLTDSTYRVSTLNSWFNTSSISQSRTAKNRFGNTWLVVTLSRHGYSEMSC